mgnify:CR=1 FL=1
MDDVSVVGPSFGLSNRLLRNEVSVPPLRGLKSLIALSPRAYATRLMDFAIPWLKRNARDRASKSVRKSHLAPSDV